LRRTYFIVDKSYVRGGVESNLETFPLKFAEESFMIRPPKLDNFMQRRAKDKEVLRNVNCAEEVLVALQHKICDVAPPLIVLYARVSALEYGEIAVEAAKDSVRSALR
jgi:hypothetical protein